MECPPPMEVQDFLFKQANIGQVCEGYQNIPISSSLIAADVQRGLLYIGHNNKLLVIKPGSDSNPEWKLELDLPDRASRVQLSFDYSLLAVTFIRPSTLIYDATSIQKHKLDILHEIRLSSGPGNVAVTDFKWNPAIPEMFCSVTSDHTVGCFQVSKDKKAGVQIVGLEKRQGLEALCVSWSPKGKQLVVGCKNGDIVQLKPELKVARHLTGPNPSKGSIISILWVSNYQFCACYLNSDEQPINVMIIDAPKGAVTPKYTNYEDITYGAGPLDNLYYYFKYITEWGIIIAASSHSSEVSVLGTFNNGITWNLWQIIENGTVQLPLDRKKGMENYPVGWAVDTSTTQKLPWGTENTLPNPVPILRIIVSSGQLCSYHMVNLKENCPALCSPPTEVIPPPQQCQKLSITQNEVSFNIPSGATSTPRVVKPATSEPQLDKSKVAVNIFGNNANNSFSFSLPGEKGLSDTTLQSQNKTALFQPTADALKPGGFLGQGDGRNAIYQQDNQVNKPAFAPQTQQQSKPPTAQVTQQQPVAQNPATFSFKLDNRVEPKTQTVPLSKEPVVEQQVISQGQPEPVKTVAAPQPAQTVPSKDSRKDEALYRQFYCEEQVRFEKELKSRLDLPNWNCGTEEERNLLVKKTAEIDEFLRELKETTNGLASDIAYLKALLLQSFAWLEETKSKNSAHVSLTGRSRAEGNKLADLQRLYYYTQSQLVQATKVLDLEWAEHKNREISRMKIPSMEVVYQSLIRHGQIIAQEKKNLDELLKKWRSLARGTPSMTNLDRSMSNLSLTQANNTTIVKDVAIELRCKLIASNTKNFSREKQMKLRDLLSETAPKIVRAVRPTAVQDRLEATLSSMASLKTTETTKPRLYKTPEKTKADSSRALAETPKSRAQNPLSTLDNLVSGIGSNTGLPPIQKSSSSTAPFAGLGIKTPNVTPQKPKEPMTFSFIQTPTAAQQQTIPFGKVDSIAFGSTAQQQAKPFGNIDSVSFGSTTQQQAKPFGKVDSIAFGSTTQQQTKPFGKVDSIDFSTTTQKPVDLQVSKENAKSPGIDASSKFSMFPANTFGRLGSPEAASGVSSMGTVPKSTFSFFSSTAPPATPESFMSLPKLDNSSVLSGTTQPVVQQPSSAPSTPGSLDLNFSTRPGLSISVVSQSKGTTPTPIAATTTSAPAASSSFNLSKTAAVPTQQSSIFGSTMSQSPSVTSSMLAKSTATGSTTADNLPTGNPPPITLVPPKSIATPAPAAVSPAVPAPVATTMTMTTTTTTPAATTAASSFGTSLLLGALSSPTSSPFSFNQKPATSPAAVPGSAATAVASATAATAITATPPAPISAPNFSFGGVTSTAATTAPALSSFAGILDGTSSLSFGTPSTGNSISPAFGKTTTTPAVNIFGGSVPTGPPPSSAAASSVAATGATAMTPADSIFGKVHDSTVSSSTATSPFAAATSTAAVTTATTSSVFGGASAVTPGTSIFGGSAKAVSSTSTENSFFAKTPASTAPTTTTSPSTTSIFGAASAACTTTTFSVFGVASAACTTTSASVFGSNSAPTLFNVNSPTKQTSSVFGPSSLQKNIIFGGTTTTQGATPAFGGSATIASSTFGGTPAASGAATASTSIFGSTTGTTTTASSVFGGGTVASGSVFGGGTNVFGGNATFGTSSAAATTAASLFGSSAVTTTASGSIFGGTAGTAPAAAAAATAAAAPATGNVFGGGSAFGGAPAMAGSVFGGVASPAGMGSGSVFGQSAAFGAKAAFGSPTGGTGFGSPPSFGTPSGFGSAPIFGSSSPLGTASPPSSSNVFGSTTFETLGAQSGGLSFGALAQKTPEQQNPAFSGSSSFSSWR